MNFDRKIFFDLYRQTLEPDGKFTQEEVQHIDTFLNMFERYHDWFTTEQWAYIFATTYHETAHTMAPVREAFRMTEAWRKANLRYWPHYGRGYVQITWAENYKRFTAILKTDLGISITKRDDFLSPDVAFYTMIYGFRHGSFTGKKISDYVSLSSASTERDEVSKGTTAELSLRYSQARACINGSDRAALIASHAIKFLNILKQAIQ